MIENHLTVLLNILKLPFVFIGYVLYMFLTIFVPSKYVSKLIKIEVIEEHMNMYFSHPLYLKFIALIITIIVFIYFN